MLKYAFITLVLALPLAVGAQTKAPERSVSWPSGVLLLRGGAARVARPVVLPVVAGLKVDKNPRMHPIFLPTWRSEDLPVFCRIEHEMGKKMPLMVKFRLGSVEYVDALEGK